MAVPRKSFQRLCRPVVPVYSSSAAWSFLQLLKKKTNSKAGAEAGKIILDMGKK
jgi:hypothetical protein